MMYGLSSHPLDHYWLTQILIHQRIVRPPNSIIPIRMSTREESKKSWINHCNDIYTQYHLPLNLNFHRIESNKRDIE